jgi:hypothetical protein
MGQGGDVDMSIGITTYDGATIVQNSVGIFSDNGADTSDTAGQLSDHYGWLATDADGILATAITYSDIDSSGFNATTAEGDADNTDIAYFCVNFNDAIDVELDIVDTPASTGSDSYTSLGFKPQAILGLGTDMAAVDTAYDNGLAGTLGVMFADATNQYMNSIQIEDGQGTSDTQSYTDVIMVHLREDDGTVLHNASLTSFDAAGWTWYWNTALHTSKYIMLAFSEAEGGIVPLRRRIEGY